MLTCVNLSKSYYNKPVIKDFFADFPATGFFLLLGESGSGKTTFLNLLAGMIKPDTGVASLNGKTIATADSALPQEMDYITQDTFFVDYLNVGDNLRLLGASDMMILSSLKEFGLADKLQDYPPTLSGGERARLALVRSMIKGKKILLLDEPTAALDEENKRQVFEMLSVMGRQSLILCASHDPEAILFADSIIHFSKNDPTPVIEDNKREKTTIGYEPKQIQSAESLASPPLKPYLMKWFYSGRRESHARLLFFAFLVISVMFLWIADTPHHKLSATCENVFRINALKLSMSEDLMLRDLNLDLSEVNEVVLDYRDTCPFEGPSTTDASQKVRYDRNFVALPEHKELFRLSSALVAGHYFDATNQVIISFEMAEALSPGEPGKLIGRTISRSFYRYGNMDLTIIGVFRKFNQTEMAYLNSCGGDYDLTNYDPNNYRGLFFINSALIKGLVEEESFCRDNGYRSCILFFDSYSATERFITQNQKTVLSNKNISADVILPVDLPYRVDAHSRLLLPLAIMISVFTVLFYAELGKTELLYNHDFVSVFEYAGYPREQILRLLIFGAAKEYMKLLALACTSGGLIALLINRLNRDYNWFNLELFSIEPWLMMVWLSVSVILSIIFIVLRFRKVQIASWYENILDTRDVI